MTVKKNLKAAVRENRGVTMVELIVTFALLAAFLALTSLCLSHAILFYYETSKSMSAYTVADLVLSELKDDIRTMQGSGDGLNGYVKLRAADGHGNLVPAVLSGGAYEGTSIEFVVSNLNDGATAVLLDTEGCVDTLIDEEGKKEIPAGDGVISTADLPHDYLTMRYYRRYPETQNPGYKNLYMDTIVSGTSAETSGKYPGLTSSKVVWHAQEKLPTQAYQGYTVELSFGVQPEADALGNQVVYAVDVTVRVKEEDRIVCEKRRRVDLQNRVYYQNGHSLYSDGAE